MMFYVYLVIAFFSGLLSLGNVLADEKPVVKPAIAVFSGGCFWCMQPPFDELPGIIKTIVGYTGGQVENPTYKEVSNGKTGHLEAVQVIYDPAKISFEKLLDVFWLNIDPYDDEGQFCDKGEQYKAVVFYQDEKEKLLAEASKIETQKKLQNKHIVTSIKPAGRFFSAEDVHQNYHKKNPITYKFYRYTCGRERRLRQVWGIK